MKAVQIPSHGGREVLEYAERSRPELTAGEALVRVEAGGLNHVDVWTRKGVTGADLELPHVPGSDAVATVEAVGDGVDSVTAGDRVIVWAGRNCGDCEFCRAGEPTLCVDYHLLGEHVPGVHAEYAAVPAENLVPVPKDVPRATAAGAPLVFGTAWRMLHTRGDVAAGETVLVLGASGGVGHAAVQIAAHAGCEVIATASSEDKRDRIAALGADHTVDYTDDGFADAVRDLTDGRGVDVVVDHVGAATWENSLASLAKGGRLLTCGATTGPRPETPVNRVFWNQLDIRGSTMAGPAELDRVLPLVWDGTFEVAIRAELPMSDIAEAHRLLEEREGVGKVVVVPDARWDEA